MREQLRGSSLLLGGRFVALFINLAVQILTIRYLSREGYGAFAYALAMADLGTTVSLLGLDKAMVRFAAIYYEQKDYPRVFGSILLAFSLVTITGLVIVGGVFALQGSLGTWLQAESNSVRLLVLLMALAPLNAADAILGALYAVFSKPRAIFFRRYLLGPGLKLASIAITIAMGGNAEWLAMAYVGSMALGIVIYAAVLIHVLRGHDEFRQWNPRSIRVPFRELVGYSLPMVSSDLVFLFHNSAVVFFLEYFHRASDVAAFQAVKPFSRLNLVVVQSFVILFSPAIARLIARNQREKIGPLYHTTVWWIAVLTFPLFAVTFMFSDQIAALALGAAYQDVGNLLALMTTGYFLYAVLSMNLVTLKMLRHIKLVAMIDVLTLVVAVACCYTVIPVGGVLGAVLTLNFIFIFHGILSLFGLGRAAGVHLFQGKYIRAYMGLAAATAILAAVKVIAPHSITAATGATLVGFFVLGINVRGIGGLQEVFPELARLPGFGKFVSFTAKATDTQSPAC